MHYLLRTLLDDMGGYIVLLTYRKPPIIVCIFAALTRDLIVWAYTRVSLSVSLKARLHGYSELS